MVSERHRNIFKFSDINDCQPNSAHHPNCLNEGVCVDGINSFTCNCAHGYIGDDCSISMNCTILIALWHRNAFHVPHICDLLLTIPFCRYK